MEKKRMHIDLAEKDLKNVAINDTVTVTVVGKVQKLDAGEKPDKKSKDKEYAFEGFPPEMCIEVEKVVVKVGNEFSSLSED